MLDAGKRLILFFEAVDGDAVVFLNGKKIGDHLLQAEGVGYDEPFYFDLTDIVEPGKTNQLAVLVRKDFAVGGLTKSVRLLEVDSINAPVE